MAQNLDDTNIEVADGLRVGDVLAGKYRIDRILGEGGMGIVAAAWHTQLEQRVAIKFLLPEGMDNEETVARFTREARAAVKIQSEHVARVIDVGNLESGAPYMVMEYLEGSDLSDRMQAHGTLAIKKSVDFIVQACDAVAEAHCLGIVHRDLKPANLYVITRPDGSEAVKVLDFGISKTTGSGSEMDMTKTHRMMGSPYYMSPEQMASSRDVDTRTDMWALAVTLYELLTGTTPFRGDSLPELCIQVTQDAPMPLCDLRPDAPEELQHVIERCLEKKRDDRYPNIAAMAMDLAPFGSAKTQVLAERITRMLQTAGLIEGDLDLPPESEIPPPRAGRHSGVGSRTQATWQTTNRGAKGRRIVPIAAVAAVSLVALGAAALWLSSGTAEQDGASAASAAAAASAEAPAASEAAHAAPSSVAGTPQPSAEVTPTQSAEPTVAPAPATASPPPLPAAQPVQPRPTTPRPASGTTRPAPQPAKPSSGGDVYDYRK